MSLWWFIPAAGAASFILTAMLRRYALARSLMDVPNARSSHTVPTPRGGGVAIVVVFLAVFSAMFAQSWIQSQVFYAIAGAGLLIAVIGFMDDHGHIAARWRLLGHFAASVWLLVWIGGLPVLQIWGGTFNLGWLGHVLAVFYLVWLLNLYNFMDGIDGIASVEAVCVCLGACVLYWAGNATPLISAPLLLAGSVGGFLIWNFPPARIFMGDAGSGFLGIVLGGFSLQAAWVSTELLWGWLILLGVFIVDATLTLLRRLFRGEKVYEAHRSHAYQFASRQFGNHLSVTAIVGSINVLWLLPIALAVTRFGLDPALGMVVAYLPLVVLAARFNAGAREA